MIIWLPITGRRKFCETFTVRFVLSGQTRLRKIPVGQFSLGYITVDTYSGEFVRCYISIDMYINTFMHRMLLDRQSYSDTLHEQPVHMCTLYAIPRENSKIGRLLKSSTICTIRLAAVTYSCRGGGVAWPAIACAVIALLRHCSFLITSRNFQMLGWCEVTTLTIFRCHPSTELLVFGKSSMARLCIFHIGIAFGGSRLLLCLSSRPT